MTHLPVTYKKALDGTSMRGIVYRYSWWNRIFRRSGRFDAVYSGARRRFAEGDCWTCVALALDEFDFGGLRWFLDRKTGEVVVADRECGMSTSHTLRDGEAMLMEVGVLRTLDLGAMHLRAVVASMPLCGQGM